MYSVLKIVKFNLRLSRITLKPQQKLSFSLDQVILKKIYRAQSKCLQQEHAAFKEKKYWEWKFDNWSYIPLSIIFASAFTVAHCDSLRDSIDIESKQEKRLLKAVQYGLTHEVSNMIKNGVDVNLRHNLGWTPLMVAAVSGHYDVVKLLLANGANPNLPDNYINPQRTAQEKGLRPIEVFMRRDEEFSSLLNNKATFRGFTALHYATLIDNFDIAKLLIENGANPCLETEAGQKPLTYAKDGPLKKFLQLQTEKYEEIQKEKDLEERRKFPLEDRLKKYIVGQEGAIATVAATVRRKENGWTDGDHPVVFLFLGSSGIGKTELAKQLAHYIHKDKKESFIRLDMSEFQEKHEVAKLIGAPPGYIGHDEGGQLTKRLKTCPDAVVLFDEVDKAHPDVLTVLLQLFDEGRLTDGQGKTIECKNAIFVMTSNLASQEIAHHALTLREGVEKLKEERLKNASKDETNSFSEDIVISRKFKDAVVKPILKRHFKRDEFLGRINEIIYFLPFSRSELVQLVQRELECWAQRAKERHKIDIKWDRNVESALADGYDVCYGARSIKYEVERRVVNQLAAAHENGVIGKGSSINITATWPENAEYAEIKIQVKNNGYKDFIDIGSSLPIKKASSFW
ncbi:mitochondrial disaggregase-like isoform X1 [Euwallacea similis]|uniref:mitochondrial disaggregase-like isoform X1 n=2 Tax=Euwallacea similis TaxID=1736056 RepID=UPI00344E5D2C